ncbi:MAG: transposase [Reichenbachiella sp.]
MGKIYFYTATINDWKYVLLENDRKQIILNSLQWLVEQQVVKVYAFVIMPNHVHFIWKPIPNEKAKNIQLSFMKFTAQQILFQM